MMHVCLRAPNKTYFVNIYKQNRNCVSNTSSLIFVQAYLCFGDQTRIRIFHLLHFRPVLADANTPTLPTSTLTHELTGNCIPLIRYFLLSIWKTTYI